MVELMSQRTVIEPLIRRWGQGQITRWQSEAQTLVEHWTLVLNSGDQVRAQAAVASDLPAAVEGYTTLRTWQNSNEDSRATLIGLVSLELNGFRTTVQLLAERNDQPIKQQDQRCFEVTLSPHPSKMVITAIRPTRCP